MRISKLILFSVCFLLVSPLHAQLTPLGKVAVSSVAKSGVKRQIGQAGFLGSLARPAYMAGSVSLSELRQFTQPGVQITVSSLAEQNAMELSVPVRPEGLKPMTEEPVTNPPVSKSTIGASPSSILDRTIQIPKNNVTSSERYVSPFRDFLKEEWEMPERSRFSAGQFASDWGIGGRGMMGVDPLRSVAIEFGMPVQISRENVQMQAKAMGIPPETVEKATKEQLWLLMCLYENMAESGQIVSRYDDFAKQIGEEKSDVSVARWAEKQPDFIAGNYVTAGYFEPFHPQITQLRVLVINDSKKVVERLLSAAEEDTRVSINYVDNVISAFLSLKGSVNKYDVVLTDFNTHAGNAQELAMWAYRNDIHTPIIFFSNAGASASWLYSYNLKGSIDIKHPGQAVLNYLSNIVATGKAYPSR